MFSSHPSQLPEDHRHQRCNTLGDYFRLSTGMVWKEQAGANALGIPLNITLQC